MGKRTTSIESRNVLTGGPSAHHPSMKARLLSAVAAAELSAVADMLDRIWAMGRFHVRRAPRAGLIMCTVRDPFDTPFHLGEILVTETEVTFDGRTGCGVVLGDEPERALLLAAIEAVEAGGRTSLLADIQGLVDRMTKGSADQAVLTSKLAASTAVQFESMQKENVDFGTLGE
jgi:alpha-D-ribose 1-methylphosphonate 5-triphosphate synthase subunit PhnG